MDGVLSSSNQMFQFGDFLDVKIFFLSGLSHKKANSFFISYKNFPFYLNNVS